MGICDVFIDSLLIWDQFLYSKIWFTRYLIIYFKTAQKDRLSAFLLLIFGNLNSSIVVHGAFTDIHYFLINMRGGRVLSLGEDPTDLCVQGKVVLGSGLWGLFVILKMMSCAWGLLL